MRRQIKLRRFSVATKTRSQCGFTLTEMLIATVIVLVGLVAVAQLVPISVLLNSNNRNDGSALVIAQREMEALRAVPLNSSSFTDTQGIVCPLSSTCLLGDPTNMGAMQGSPVVSAYGSPIIDFSADPVSGYSFSFIDPNDPTGAVNDIRWAVLLAGVGTTPSSRRIIVGVFRRGMKTPSYPVTLDSMVSK